MKQSKEFLIGTAILQVGYPDEALPWLEKASADQSAPYLSNLGACLRQLSRFEESSTALEQALVIDPSFYNAYSNMGMLFSDLGQFEEAEQSYGRAQRLAPHDVTVALNLAMARLRLGKWDSDTWRLWEFGRSAYNWMYPKIPRWTGKENIAGKRLLVCREGGFGDAIMYLRWCADLQRMGASVHFWVWDRLVPLLAGHPWITRILPAKKDDVFH